MIDFKALAPPEHVTLLRIKSVFDALDNGTCEFDDSAYLGIIKIHTFKGLGLPLPDVRKPPLKLKGELK